ncbi:chitobiosyldiphosphodolichol beta-mannosyltransferase [Halyomorpha halys]|uniref:chitobiosyldiphosphodolichol beta-mannosyltransferase n=1 Tax=Halyomorpha halys TaxID=286706 RepID=UPI0006D4DC26|nr:chitobiosyldiphosphodolichol beta-mannosyltransferase [Halyomorpha halys]
MAPKNVCVVGLADIGRSPRLQYHCISLAEEGYHVNVIGYRGAKPKKQMLSNNNITIAYLPPVPEVNKYLPRILAYLFKVIWQSISLFFFLLFKRRSHFVFVQTPPAIPVFAVAWLYSLLVAATFVIDWHNYAYSLMALTLGERSFIVRASYWFECYFGQKAAYNLCVTNAMRMDLIERWAIVSRVLHDRAPSEFRRATLEETHNLLTRLSQRYPLLGGAAYSTLFTRLREDGTVEMREDRPALLVSSTSWTEDEDFNILFSALIDYDKSDRKDIPPLICAITGRGPLKDYYIGIIQASTWNRVSIITPWLEEADYPTLLGSADLGVSLHMSSSGLDLPMKVVDMFGCGLPVFAHDFKCVGELVRNGENGLVFSDAVQLSSMLIDWFSGFPKVRHEKFEKGIKEFQSVRWHQAWLETALPVFKK